MKILVIKFRNIGDVLLSTPLIDNLQYHFPDAKIDFSLNQGCEDMITENPNINKIILYDRVRIKNLNIFSRLKAEWKFAQTIRNSKYDIVINLTEGDRGAQLALISGAKIKMGLPVKKGILSKIKIFDKIGEDKKQQQHAVEKDLQFIKLLDKEIYSRRVSIFWTQDEERVVDKILRENGILSFVHIHPVSRWMHKCWEDDKMAEIVDYLNEKKGLSVVISGAPISKELERIEKILGLCKTRALNLSGKLTLKQLAYLSSRAKLFFGVDTAPMHMAAINTPVLALFGISYPSIWGPWNNNKSRKLFFNISSVQSNGKHKLISNTTRGICYENGVKKSRGMMLIDCKTVKKAIDSMV
jgi:heptosyltransferase-3